MTKLFNQYKQISRNTLNLIMVNFCFQLLNSCFFIVLNIYMANCGYTDAEIAYFVSFRYLAVILFALPFGVSIKGLKLRPIFITASILLPIISFISVQLIALKYTHCLMLFLILWGVALSAKEISTLPYILRNEKYENHTNAVALNFSTWSISIIIAGLFIHFSQNLYPNIFNNKFLLQLFCFFACFGIYFAFKLAPTENIELTNLPSSDTFTEANNLFESSFLNDFKIKIQNAFINYDWSLIFKAVFPTTLIAIGAGLAIPFMNLFFLKVFGFNSDKFALLGAASSVLVAICSLLVPTIKSKFGYRSVTLTQLLAVMALATLATTNYFNQYPAALVAAIIAYLFRQPLMNMAAPLTSELTMYYVGKQNQEITSALISSIWAGSWFFSSLIFGILRSQNLQYGSIFYITCILYLYGIARYHNLINDFNTRQQNGLLLEN